jgi:hypothetical protein
MPRRFIPGETTPGTQFIGGCKDSKASPGVMGKNEISSLYQELNHNSSVAQLIV